MGKWETLLGTQPTVAWSTVAGRAVGLSQEGLEARATPPGGGDMLGKDLQLHTSRRKSKLAAAGLYKWECRGFEMGYSTVLAT